MEYKFRTETSVKPLLKWLDWDHTIRNHLLTGESRLNLLASEATWSDSKILKCKDNYIKRIEKGKVKIFYIDLVKHTLDEMGKDVEKGPSTWIYNRSARINKVNRYYRLYAYYEALKELAPDYLSTSK